MLHEARPDRRGFPSLPSWPSRENSQDRVPSCLGAFVVNQPKTFETRSSRRPRRHWISLRVLRVKPYSWAAARRGRLALPGLTSLTLRPTREIRQLWHLFLANPAGWHPGRWALLPA